MDTTLFHWRRFLQAGIVSLFISLMGFATLLGAPVIHAQTTDLSRITLPPSTSASALAGATYTEVATVVGPDGTTPASGVSVTFSINSTTVGTRTTDSNGLANYVLFSNEQAATYTIQASFVDSTGATITSNSTTFTWTNATKLTLSSSVTTTTINSPATATVTLVGPDGTPVNNAGVFIFDPTGQSGYTTTVQTNAGGQASFSVPPLSTAGTRTLQAKYNDADHNPYFSNQIVITYQDATALTLATSVATTTINSPVTATVTLVGPDGSPLNNASVSFFTPTQFLTTLTTDGSGQASFSVPPLDTPGTLTLQAKYDDANHHPYLSNQVVITYQDASSITLSTSATSAYLGQQVALNATTNGIDGSPVANETVTFTVVSGPDTGVIGTATTDGSGKATLNYSTITNAGSDLVQASFTDSEGVSRTSTTVQVTWLAPVVTAVALTATEGTSFSGVVANVTGAPALPTASISWGDGQTSNGTVNASGSASFTIQGSHTYAEEGSYQVTITVQEINGQTTTSSATATVSDASLAVTKFVTGATKKGVAALAALFLDADPNGTTGDYQATINWGDGKVSQGLIVKNPLGKGFALAGAHQYTQAGSYSVTLTISDGGGSSITVTQTLVVPN